jgi:hypothetical protein
MKEVCLKEIKEILLDRIAIDNSNPECFDNIGGDEIYFLQSSSCR